VSTAQGPRTSDVEKGLKPYIRIWGVNSNPVWAPNSRKLAFVSRRTDHSFIAVYDLPTRKVTYISPSVDFDTSPSWSADSKRIAFIRRPGTPFGQQSQAGVGGIGGPGGPGSGRGRGAAIQAGAPARGGRGGRGADPAAADGLYQAAFRRGYTDSPMV